MRVTFILTVALAFAALPGEAEAQLNRKKEEDFVKAHPTVGDSLPNVSAYTSDGKPFAMADLQGHYAVLTFGCLT